jgi:hypothetical protein
MTVRAHVALPDEVEAAERGVLGLTAAVGAMAALTSAAIGDSLWIVALPTSLAVALLLAGRTTVAAYAGTAVWLAFIGHASGEALLVPLAMALACLAIGIGPDRLLGWLWKDFGAGDRPDREPVVGWIEDQPPR